jgi:hypothetical protein
MFARQEFSAREVIFPTPSFSTSFWANKREVQGPQLFVSTQAASQ